MSFVVFCRYAAATATCVDYITRGGTIQYSVIDMSGDEHVACPLSGKDVEGTACEATFGCPDALLRHLSLHDEPLSFSLVVNDKYLTGIPATDDCLSFTLIKDLDGHPVYQKRTSGCGTSGCESDSSGGTTVYDCAGCCSSFCADHVQDFGLVADHITQFCNLCLADKPRRDSQRVRELINIFALTISFTKCELFL